MKAVPSAACREFEETAEGAEEDPDPEKDGLLAAPVARLDRLGCGDAVRPRPRRGEQTRIEELGTSK